MQAHTSHSQVKQPYSAVYLRLLRTWNEYKKMNKICTHRSNWLNSVSQPVLTYIHHSAHIHTCDCEPYDQWRITCSWRMFSFRFCCLNIQHFDFNELIFFSFHFWLNSFVTSLRPLPLCLSLPAIFVSTNTGYFGVACAWPRWLNIENALCVRIY